MILTTIALVWFSTATVFALALGMAAAKPIPQPQGFANEFANFNALSGEFDDDAPPMPDCPYRRQ
jgi:hypothetical protein